MLLTGGIILLLAGVAIPIAYLQLQAGQDELAANWQQAAADAVLEDPTIYGAPDGQTSTKAATPSSTLGLPAVVAKLFVPRFGSTWSRLVYEGTGVSRVLTPLGVGHYTQSAAPGQLGNFALAAHRAGSGGPFRKIDQFRAGDLVFVETSTQRFTYRYLESAIVDPKAIGVIAADPMGLKVKSTSGAYLTLTSCTPIHVNTQRFVAWFELVDSQPIE